MRRAALTAIGIYQRYVSPYKGFCCAHRQHLGGASCSTLGFRAIRRHGVFKGCAITRIRLARCGEVHRQFHPRARTAGRSQRGDCDLGGCDIAGEACDACDCGDCGGSNRKKKKST